MSATLGYDCQVVCPQCGHLAPVTETPQLQRFRRSIGSQVLDQRYNPYYLMWKLVASLPLKRLDRAAYPIPPGLLISPRKKSQKGGQQLAVSV